MYYQSMEIRMTRKDYVAVAKVLREGRKLTTSDGKKFLNISETDFSRLVILLSRTFRMDNPRFDHSKFYEACGIDYLNQIEEVIEKQL